MKDLIIKTVDDDEIEALSFSELDDDNEVELIIDFFDDSSHALYFNEKEMIRIRDHFDNELKKIKSNGN